MGRENAESPLVWKRGVRSKDLNQEPLTFSQFLLSQQDDGDFSVKRSFAGIRVVWLFASNTSVLRPQIEMTPR